MAKSFSACRRPSGKRRSRFGWSAAAALVAMLTQTLLPGQAFAETIVLKNGTQLEGSVGTIASLKNPVLNPAGGGGVGAGIKPVVVVDDGLRRTLVPALQVTALPAAPEVPQVKIAVPQRVATAGFSVNTVGPILKVTEFDAYGRRIFSMVGGGPRPTINVVQGITEVTPLYTRVQGLSASTSYVWDMRIATSSIPRPVLSRVLKGLDPDNAGHRLEIVRLYIQADRIHDARAELEEVVADFPDMPGLQAQVDILRQMGAQRLIKEIRLRADAGQHRMAVSMAASFPVEGVADATVLTVRDINREYEEQYKKYEEALAELAALLEKVEDESVRDKLAPYCDEIAADLNVNTLDRMADFIRLADDEKLAPEERVSLALTGWILGSGGATENSAIALSIGQVRDLVREYLTSATPEERAEILNKLKGLEGSSPPYLARIVAHMKPPREVPEREDEEAAIPGLYEITVPGVKDDIEFSYTLQLPPEYDPYRRYPCIVTLHAAGTTPEKQIEWWAGAYNEETKMRAGQAARHGYIVLAPKWAKEHQQSYEHSSREHAAVLLSLRDALKQFAIDTDRVYLSGHSLGGDAAWDIALAHPDLWAGVIPIGANCEKYVVLYWENGRNVPMYFVVGEKDGKRAEETLVQWDRYMRYSGFDVTVTEYLGRGHEHFYEEIQRIFDWTKLHQRNFAPEKFSAKTLRPFDNFFWWVEIDKFPPTAMVTPLNWPPPRSTPGISVEARLLRETNGMTMKTGGQSGRVFFLPEMLNFEESASIFIGGKRLKNPPAPSVEVLLEDVRTRGDRQHPFWASVDFPVR
jgi:predicted esterase